MVRGVNLQIFMHSPGVLETSCGVNRQPEEESALFLNQTYWADILYSLNAINKTTCAFDDDETRLASKTVIEMLSISCFVLFSARLDEVQEELLYYPRRRRWRRRRR